MSVAGQLGRGMATLVSAFGAGKTVTQRRRHTVKSGAGMATTLDTNGAASSGAASVNFDGTRLSGTLTAGVQGTFSGHGTTYTVTGDVEVASGALASVGLTPVLASNVADDEVFTISRPYVEYTWRGYRRNYMTRDFAATDIDLNDFQLVIDMTAAPDDAGGAALTWRDGDQVDYDGEIYEIRRVETMRPGDVTTGAVLHVGKS